MDLIYLPNIVSVCHHPGLNPGRQYINCRFDSIKYLRVQELCESRGGRPGFSVIMSFTISVDVKQH